MADAANTIRGWGWPRAAFPSWTTRGAVGRPFNVQVAIAQLNPTIGDFEGNVSRLRDAYLRASREGADLVVAPELFLTGYPPRDLLERPAFLDAGERALADLAAGTGKAALVVGHPQRRGTRTGRPLSNAASLLRRGRVEGTVEKTLLPTYDVFDEDRWFEPRDTRIPPPVWIVAGQRVGVSICEDMWAAGDAFSSRAYGADPIAALADAGAQVLVNLSASPWVLGKERLRWERVAAIASRFSRPFVFANQVGGNDELVFDGNSCAAGAAGQCLARGAAFREDLVRLDTASRERGALAWAEDEETLAEALGLGLWDYLRTCGFREVLVGLSGGIDSAVTAALAARALGPQAVTGVAMPSRFNAPESLDDARALAGSLGIRFLVVPIEPAFEATLQSLRPVLGEGDLGLTQENLQSRLRGLILMALSNRTGAMVLSTGNKSEMATGFCTLYGDLTGGLAILSDIPKGWVYRLGRYLNRARNAIPERTFTRAPTAELRPDQTDQDTLPPYEIVDAVLAAAVGEGLDATAIAERGLPISPVRDILRRIDASEYKRRQAPPGLKVTSKAFGAGRRLPIARKT